MLCGISVRFQTLSPTQGQVAHALLTRPPLTQPRRASSVRLECVMHAASVHPEPGSNSRKYCILSPFGVKTYSRAFVALLLLLCLSSISQFELFEFTSHFFVFALYFSLRCSIFNDRSSPQFLTATLLLYHTSFPLSILFSKFFQLFSKLFSKVFWCDSSNILSL